MGVIDRRLPLNLPRGLGARLGLDLRLVLSILLCLPRDFGLSLDLARGGGLRSGLRLEFRATPCLDLDLAR